MIAGCLSFLLLWSSLLITDFSVPDFEQDVMGLKVSNLSCSKINIGAMSGTFNSSLWSLETKDPSDVACTVTLKMDSSSYQVHTDAVLSPSHISLSKTADNTCYSTNSTVDICGIDLEIEQVRFDPPSLFLGLFVGVMKKAIKEKARDFVCGSGIKSLQSELQNHTLALPKPYPQLNPNATPLEGTVLFRTLVNVINNAPPILGIQLGASLHAGTTVRLNLGFTNGLNFQLDDFSELVSFLEKLADILKT
ncbi:hypothetical protein LSM04_007411, partial [Trypanosoma melophagium]|uniref:uncharacterized protein n=1 Tax=Trypanosoma melophagium TaxID=715481 RepID=UPI00351A7141